MRLQFGPVHKTPHLAVELPESWGTELEKWGCPRRFASSEARKVRSLLPSDSEELFVTLSYLS